MTINHLLHRPHLQHTFFALRHGQSLANVAKIISSDPAISTVQHGLSEKGKEQAVSAGEDFAKSYLDTTTNTNSEECYEGVAIFSSDFTRARETAQLFTSQLTKYQIPIYTNQVVIQTSLRERYFGELNGGPDDRYQSVWDVDCKDADHMEFGVESANGVLGRTTRLVTEIDDLLSTATTASGDEGKKKWKVVLVAHGDVLQIMQTGFLRHEDAKRHRSLEHLETATIRELMLA